MHEGMLYTHIENGYLRGITIKRTLYGTMS